MANRLWQRNLKKLLPNEINHIIGFGRAMRDVQRVESTPLVFESYSRQKALNIHLN